MRIDFLRRMKPMLGTLVEIKIPKMTNAIEIFDRCFHEIQILEKALSFFDPDSDISKINKNAIDCPIRVSQDTFDILKIAKEFNVLTRGLFNCHRCDLETSKINGDSGDLKLLPDQMVSFSRPLCIDLSGIAKGYIVDKAHQFLTNLNVSEGVINAGGDIRLWGNNEHEIWARSPQNPLHLKLIDKVKNISLATSASYWIEESIQVGIIDPRTRERINFPYSVTVYAQNCYIADALTKYLALDQVDSLNILGSLNARAILVFDIDNQQKRLELP